MNTPNTTNITASGRPKSVLDEVAAQIRAMHKQDMLDRKTTILLVDRFEEIVVPEQPFRCLECGCRDYRIICGARHCSYGQGRDWILNRPKGAP
jgi:hypothetical protein